MKTIKAFMQGCLVTALIFSLGLNVYLYKHTGEYGYTKEQRERMDKLVSTLDKGK